MQNKTIKNKNQMEPGNVSWGCLPTSLGKALLTKFGTGNPHELNDLTVKNWTHEIWDLMKEEETGNTECVLLSCTPEFSHALEL